MRRLLSVSLLTVLLGVLLMAMALPGLAADSEEAPAETTEMSEEHSEEEEHAEEDDHGSEDDEGQWTGLLGAFGAAVLFGTFAFVSSGTEGLGEDHH